MRYADPFRLDSRVVLSPVRKGQEILFFLFKQRSTRYTPHILFSHLLHSRLGDMVMPSRLHEHLLNNFVS